MGVAAHGMNVALIVATLLMVIGIVIIRFKQRDVHQRPPAPKIWTWLQLELMVKEALQQLTSDPLLDHYGNEESFRREYSRRAQLRNALRSCASGDTAQKKYIISIIKELLQSQVQWSNEQWNALIAFDQPNLLTARDQFDILLYQNAKQHGYDAMHRLMQDYHWDELRQRGGDNGDEYHYYEIDEQDIKHAYRTEQLHCTPEDRIAIVAQRIYQSYKGLSVIDALRDMKIDGISGGVSGTGAYGSISTILSTRLDWNQGLEYREDTQACNSVWLFYQGKSIRLSFLGFGSESELKRVCHNIYKHGAPGPLTEADGYRVNDMKDGSRVVVLRPPFAESWSFFVRKFNRDKPSLEQLLMDQHADLAITLLRFLMKGARITAITGAQGSGKTTLLMAMIQSIYGFYPIRVQEQAFELHLRDMYPERNILTLRETDMIAGQDGLDVQKKTDGAVHILGEVASDPVAAWMIQMSQVASLFTVFTHHAKTFPDLILSLRNSLLKTGMFQNEKVAEQQVAAVIHYNIHLTRDAQGKRYIERITECIPRYGKKQDQVETRDADERSADESGAWAPYIQAASAYYIEQQQSYAFEYRNIIEYKDGRYMWVNELSDHQVNRMKEEMTAQDAFQFDQWLAARRGEHVHANAISAACD